MVARFYLADELAVRILELFSRIMNKYDAEENKPLSAEEEKRLEEKVEQEILDLLRQEYACRAFQDADEVDTIFFHNTHLVAEERIRAGRDPADTSPVSEDEVLNLAETLHEEWEAEHQDHIHDDLYWCYCDERSP